MDNCVILCGGASLRMNCDKSLLKFNNFDTLIEYQINKFRSHFKNIYLSAKNKKIDYDNFILDDFEIYSVMHTIFNVLKNFDEKIFIICVDYPFIKPSTIDTLIQNSKNFDVTIPKDKKFSHFLCGVYDPKITPIIKNLIDNKIYKIGALRDFVNFKEIEFDIKDEEFLNMNYKIDYEKGMNL